MATFDELYETHRVRVDAAFQQAINSIKSRVILRVVVDRLRAGDINGAVAAIQVEPTAFLQLERSLQDAFADGGQGLVDELPTLREPNGPAVVWQFSVRNMAAEELMRNQSSRLVTDITESQLEGLRVAFTDGLARGQNPTTTALDVVGRINKATGRREGGFIGLNAEQIKLIDRTRDRLASGEPSLMRDYLNLKTRDRRFDATVLKAIREGKPVPKAMLNRIVSRLKDRNLKLRGDTIGRNETLEALSQARENAMQQQIDSGKIRASEVDPEWDAVMDDRTRHTHVSLNGKTRDQQGYFTSSSGARLRYPHDPKAPSFETIMCRCRLKYNVDYIAAGLRKYRARTNG